MGRRSVFTWITGPLSLGPSKLTTGPQWNCEGSGRTPISWGMITEVFLVLLRRMAPCISEAKDHMFHIRGISPRSHLRRAPTPISKRLASNTDRFTPQLRLLLVHPSF